MDNEKAELRKMLQGLRDGLTGVISYLDGYRGFPPEPTIESVYGKPLAEMKPPERHTFTGAFKLPVGEELFLRTDGTVGCGATYVVCTGPRLILRRCKRLTFDILEENAFAKSGNWVWREEHKDIYRIEKDNPGRVAFVLSDPRMEE